MALLYCNHCHTTRDCKLDPENDSVVCMNCGEVVDNVSPFFVKTMKSKNEYMDKKREAFRFPCEKCGKEMKGVLSKNESQVLCSKCGTPMKVSFYMIQAMKNIQSGEGSVDVGDFNKKIEVKVETLKKNSQKKKVDTEQENVKESVGNDEIIGDTQKDGIVLIEEDVRGNSSADLDSKILITDSSVVDDGVIIE